MHPSLHPPILAALWALLPGQGLAQGHGHGQEHSQHAPGPLQWDRDWLTPWPHDHFSRRGAPYVHAITLEPAFLGRELFVDYWEVDSRDAEEIEVAAELEWALTRRIGLLLEVPFVQVDPRPGSVHSGFGDLAAGTRFLLADTQRFLLSANFEVEVPTGDEDRDLGAGETILAPSVSTWWDLGSFDLQSLDLRSWLALQAQFGIEWGAETSGSELFLNAALSWAFLPHRVPGPETSVEWRGADRMHKGHFPAGMVSLLLEFTGRTILNGDDEHRDTGELLFGTNISLTNRWDLRGGYQTSIGGPEEIDDAFVIGIVRHF